MKKVNNKKALVLVAILWLAALLTTIIIIVAKNSRLDTKVCIAANESTRCIWACRAGVQKAIAVLTEDLPDGDALTDIWNDNKEYFDDVKLSGCQFTVRVYDESAKLNINTVAREQLLSLPNMTEEIANSIIDWRDQDDTPRQGGAEGGYYTDLAYGYKIRNSWFRTIRELLLVKGVADELFYGEDTNFNNRLDDNENDGDKNPPYDNSDNKLDKGWIHYLTCCSYTKNLDAAGRERVNINSADENKLVDDLGIKKSHAKWIVNKRSTGGYNSIADLINQNSPQQSTQTDSNEAEPLDLDTFSKIADRITTTDERVLYGRVNVNTASEVVLTALFSPDEQAEKLADNIRIYREKLTGGMTSIAEVMKAESVDVKTFKKIAEYITVRSSVFSVRCFADSDVNKIGTSSMNTEAIVDRGSTPPRIIYWSQEAGS